MRPKRAFVCWEKAAAETLNMAFELRGRDVWVGRDGFARYSDRV